MSKIKYVMKTRSILTFILIGILMLNCKKKDEPVEVLPIQIISPTDNTIVHDTVPIIFKFNSALNIIRTECYVDFKLSEAFDNVPSKIYFNSNHYQKGTTHQYYLRIITKEGQTSNSNIITLIISKLTKPAVTVNFLSKTSLELTWPDNSNDENGYRVTRKEGNNIFTLIGDLGPNATSYTDNPIDTTKSYIYIVEVYSSDEKLASDSIKIEYFLNKYHFFIEYDVPSSVEGKIVISPDAQKVVVTNYWENYFTVINTANGVKTSLPQDGGSMGLAMSHNGSFFVTGNTHNSNMIKIWDLNTLSLINQFYTAHYDYELLTNHADDQLVISGEPVEIYTVADGSLVKTYLEYKTTCRSLKFSQDESLLLTGGNDQKVKIFNTGMGELIRTFTGHTGNVGTACFNQDESKIISGSYEDNTILIWDKSSGDIYKTITRNYPTVSICNGRNGEIIVASRNGLISILDQDYQVIQEFKDFDFLISADYNSSNDLIAAYGSQTDYKVKLFKKIGHWEKI
jgi:WD40 repeat protein